MRIVKNPDERRKEIMETAAQFFLTKGYEETSINAIVEHLKIAKGTFYHYFKSKEEILGAILEDYLGAFADKIGEIINNSNMNAHEKMQYVLKNIFSGNEEPKYLTEHIEDNKNAKLHQMLDEKFYEKFCPILTDIVNQGVREGIYHVEYPEEITEILLMGIRSYIHIHMPRFADAAYAVKKLKALEELFCKALGIKEGKYKIILF
jgi:AcrR family transcriptional regulator